MVAVAQLGRSSCSLARSPMPRAPPWPLGLAAVAQSAADLDRPRTGGVWEAAGAGALAVLPTAVAMAAVPLSLAMDSRARVPPGGLAC
ncbi:hypothetical protein Zm00014a_031561 [Zea mays]|uniref:Uncharacterized protein n=1 Tax=Zea mays TaxID=4577 RepID=A0A3L6D722_MAIZE|nr:hypothetical protein Zm00014a_031561 [Zea mays]